MYPHDRILGVELGQDLVEDPLVRYAKHVRLEEDLTQQKCYDEQQLQKKH